MTTDCFGKLEIEPLPGHSHAWIATVVTAGFADMLDALLDSIECRAEVDAEVAVFVVDEDAACLEVVESYGARAVRARSLEPVDITAKGALYSAALALDGERFVCLDADTLVLGSLAPLFDALEVVDQHSVLVAREGDAGEYGDLRAVLPAYWTDEQDLLSFEPDALPLLDYGLACNTGVIAGCKLPLMAVDNAIREMEGARCWMSANPACRWREQFVFNLALARRRYGVELDPLWNLQLHVRGHETTIRRNEVRVTQALWEGDSARILHFNGSARNLHPGRP